MLVFNTLVFLLLSAYAVVGRPTEPLTPTITSSSGSVEGNQGWNQSRQQTAYPIRQMGASSYSDSILNNGADSVPNGSYSTGGNAPSNANHDVFLNQMDFAGADAHRALASMFRIPNSGFLANPAENQIAGSAPVGLPAGSGVSASAAAVSISV